jgi:hypothetical protein
VKPPQSSAQELRQAAVRLMPQVTAPVRARPPVRLKQQVLELRPVRMKPQARELRPTAKLVGLRQQQRS